MLKCKEKRIHTNAVLILIINIILITTTASAKSFPPHKSPQMQTSPTNGQQLATNAYLRTLTKPAPIRSANVKHETTTTRPYLNSIEYDLRLRQLMEDLVLHSRLENQQQAVHTLLPMDFKDDYKQRLQALASAATIPSTSAASKTRTTTTTSTPTFLSFGNNIAINNIKGNYQQHQQGDNKDFIYTSSSFSPATDRRNTTLTTTKTAATSTTSSSSSTASSLSPFALSSASLKDSLLDYVLLEYMTKTKQNLTKILETSNVAGHDNTMALASDQRIWQQLQFLQKNAEKFKKFQQVEERAKNATAITEIDVLKVIDAAQQSAATKQQQTAEQSESEEHETIKLLTTTDMKTGGGGAEQSNNNEGKDVNVSLKTNDSLELLKNKENVAEAVDKSSTKENSKEENSEHEQEYNIMKILEIIAEITKLSRIESKLDVALVHTELGMENVGNTEAITDSTTIAGDIESSLDRQAEKTKLSDVNSLDFIIAKGEAGNTTIAADIESSLDRNAEKVELRNVYSLGLVSGEILSEQIMGGKINESNAEILKHDNILQPQEHVLDKPGKAKQEGAKMSSESPAIPESAIENQDLNILENKNKTDFTIRLVSKLPSEQYELNKTAAESIADISEELSTTPSPVDGTTNINTTTMASELLTKQETDVLINQENSQPLDSLSADDRVQHEIVQELGNVNKSSLQDIQVTQDGDDASEINNKITASSAIIPDPATALSNKTLDFVETVETVSHNVSIEDNNLAYKNILDIEVTTTTDKVNVFTTEKPFEIYDEHETQPKLESTTDIKTNYTLEGLIDSHKFISSSHAVTKEIQQINSPESKEKINNNVPSYKISEKEQVNSLDETQTKIVSKITTFTEEPEQILSSFPDHTIPEKVVPELRSSHSNLYISEQETATDIPDFSENFTTTSPEESSDDIWEGTDQLTPEDAVPELKNYLSKIFGSGAVATTEHPQISEDSTIYSLHVTMDENWTETDHTIPEKVVPELRNSHPNLYISEPNTATDIPNFLVDFTTTSPKERSDDIWEETEQTTPKEALPELNNYLSNIFGSGAEATTEHPEISEDSTIYSLHVTMDEDLTETDHTTPEKVVPELRNSRPNFYLSEPETVSDIPDFSEVFTTTSPKESSDDIWEGTNQPTPEDAAPELKNNIANNSSSGPETITGHPEITEDSTTNSLHVTMDDTRAETDHTIPEMVAPELRNYHPNLNISEPEISPDSPNFSEDFTTTSPKESSDDIWEGTEQTTPKKAVPELKNYIANTSSSGPETSTKHPEITEDSMINSLYVAMDENWTKTEHTTSEKLAPELRNSLPNSPKPENATDNPDFSENFGSTPPIVSSDNTWKETDKTTSKKAVTEVKNYLGNTSSSKPETTTEKPDISVDSSIKSLNVNSGDIWAETVHTIPKMIVPELRNSEPNLLISELKTVNDTSDFTSYFSNVHSDDIWDEADQTTQEIAELERRDYPSNTFIPATKTHNNSEDFSEDSAINSSNSKDLTTKSLNITAIDTLAETDQTNTENDVSELRNTRPNTFVPIVENSTESLNFQESLAVTNSLSINSIHEVIRQPYNETTTQTGQLTKTQAIPGKTKNNHWFKLKTAALSPLVKNLQQSSSEILATTEISENNSSLGEHPLKIQSDVTIELPISRPNIVNTEMLKNDQSIDTTKDLNNFNTKPVTELVKSEAYTATTQIPWGESRNHLTDIESELTEKPSTTETPTKEPVLRPESTADRIVNYISEVTLELTNAVVSNHEMSGMPAELPALETNTFTYLTESLKTKITTEIPITNKYFATENDTLTEESVTFSYPMENLNTELPISPTDSVNSEMIEMPKINSGKTNSSLSFSENQLPTETKFSPTVSETETTNSSLVIPEIILPTAISNAPTHNTSTQMPYLTVGDTLTIDMPIIESTTLLIPETSEKSFIPKKSMFAAGFEDDNDSQELLSTKLATLQDMAIAASTKKVEMLSLGDLILGNMNLNSNTPILPSPSDSTSHEAEMDSKTRNEHSDSATKQGNQYVQLLSELVNLEATEAAEAITKELHKTTLVSTAMSPTLNKSFINETVADNVQRKSQSKAPLLQENSEVSDPLGKENGTSPHTAQTINLSDLILEHTEFIRNATMDKLALPTSNNSTLPKVEVYRSNENRSNHSATITEEDQSGAVEENILTPEASNAFVVDKNQETNGITNLKYKMSNASGTVEVFAHNNTINEQYFEKSIDEIPGTTFKQKSNKVDNHGSNIKTELPIANLSFESSKDATNLTTPASNLADEVMALPIDKHYFDPSLTANTSEFENIENIENNNTTINSNINITSTDSATIQKFELNHPENDQSLQMSAEYNTSFEHDEKETELALGNLKSNLSAPTHNLTGTSTNHEEQIMTYLVNKDNIVNTDPEMDSIANFTNNMSIAKNTIEGIGPKSQLSTQQPLENTFHEITTLSADSTVILDTVNVSNQTMAELPTVNSTNQLAINSKVKPVLNLSKEHTNLSIMDLFNIKPSYLCNNYTQSNKSQNQETEHDPLKTTTTVQPEDDYVTTKTITQSDIETSYPSDVISPDLEDILPELESFLQGVTSHEVNSIKDMVGPFERRLIQELKQIKDAKDREKELKTNEANPNSVIREKNVENHDNAIGSAASHDIVASTEDSVIIDSQRFPTFKSVSNNQLQQDTSQVLLNENVSQYPSKHRETFKQYEITDAETHQTAHSNLADGDVAIISKPITDIVWFIQPSSRQVPSVIIDNVPYDNALPEPSPFSLLTEQLPNAAKLEIIKPQDSPERMDELITIIGNSLQETSGSNTKSQHVRNGVTSLCQDNNNKQDQQQRQQHQGHKLQEQDTAAMPTIGNCSPAIQQAMQLTTLPSTPTTVETAAMDTETLATPTTSSRNEQDKVEMMAISETIENQKDNIKKWTTFKNNHLNNDSLTKADEQDDNEDAQMEKQISDEDANDKSPDDEDYNEYNVGEKENVDGGYGIADESSINDKDTITETKVRQDIITANRNTILTEGHPEDKTNNPNNDQYTNNEFKVSAASTTITANEGAATQGDGMNKMSTIETKLIDTSKEHPNHMAITEMSMGGWALAKPMLEKMVNDAPASDYTYKGNEQESTLPENPKRENTPTTNMGDYDEEAKNDIYVKGDQYATASADTDKDEVKTADDDNDEGALDDVAQEVEQLSMLADTFLNAQSFSDVTPYHSNLYNPHSNWKKEQQLKYNPASAVHAKEEITTTNWWRSLPYAEIRKFLNTIFDSVEGW